MSATWTWDFFFVFVIVFLLCILCSLVWLFQMADTCSIVIYRKLIQNVVVIDGFYLFIYGWFIIPLFVSHCALSEVCYIYTTFRYLAVLPSWGRYVTFLYTRLFSSENVECRRMSNEIKVERPKFLNRIMTGVPRILVRIWERGFGLLLPFPNILNSPHFGRIY